MYIYYSHSVDIQSMQCMEIVRLFCLYSWIMFEQLL